MSGLLVQIPEVVPAGDAAALLVIGEEMSLEVMAQSHSLARAIKGEQLGGVRAVVIGRSSVMVHYDPLVLSLEEIRAVVERLVGQGLEAVAPEGRLRELPTVYGGSYGPDLPYAAQYHHMSEEEVVQLQSGATYVVCSLGFAPGQPLLMGLPRELVLPRRDNPRAQVPAGSVLIASQTSLYSLPNPTGWWLIGRIPIKLFDPSADPPTFLLAGDRVRFIPISEKEYLRLGGETAK